MYICMILIYNYVLSSKIFGECFTCSTFIECLLGVRKVFSVFQLISLKQTKLGPLMHLSAIQQATGEADQLEHAENLAYSEKALDESATCKTFTKNLG